MSRLVRLVFHNWPLKLGAVALATLLYAGLVVSSSARLFEGSVPIEAPGLTGAVTILSDLGAVRQVRYLAPDDLGLRLDSASFRASVDLSGVDPAGGRVSIAVRVTAIDSRIQILDYEPRQIVVEIDTVVSRTVPVRVVLGPVPSGLALGDPMVDDTSVTITGASGLVSRVAEVQARITVDASGIDINRVVELLPVDAAGELVTPVDAAPATTRVRLPIFTDRQTRTLPVRPIVIGSPAAGFEVASVAVSPLVVAVEGDVDDLVSLEVADTVPISITGSTSDLAATTTLALPDGVQALGERVITVTVTLRPITATRTFEAGLLLVGARADRTYSIVIDRVLVTIGGPVADLDRLSGSTLVMTLDITGLDSGTHEVAVGANLLTGLTLIAASPSPVTVVISAPSSSGSSAP
ncbi:MAG: hypothetical protein HW391_76 [Chloroflexi bacterium]|nr:hypothetical protein [Chloroflexota bacterium]